MRAVMSIDYSRRVYLAQDYIRRHCEADIELADLAKAAHFSPYHFHRIFTAFTQETPNDFLRRMRVERAAHLLFRRPAIPMLDIAVQCGFKSQAIFARAFRQHFGMTASEWRKGDFWLHDGSFWRWQHIKQQDSKECKKPGYGDALLSDLFAARREEFLAVRHGERPAFIRNLQIVEKPAFRRAFIWRQGILREQILDLWAELLHWANANGVFRPDLIGVARNLDNANVTAEALCRYEAGFVLSEDSPDFARHTGQQTILFDQIEGGLFVEIDFEGTLADETLVEEYFYNYWLPSSGWNLAHRSGYIEVPMSNALQPLHAEMQICTRWYIPVCKQRP